MAESDEGLDDKTEEATQHRRDDWRKEGQVAQSRELVAAAVLLTVTGSVWVFSQWSLKGMSALFETSFSEISRLGTQTWSIETMMTVLLYCLKNLGQILLPVGLAAVLIGVLGSFAQVGFLWTTKPIEPDLERINPLSGLQRLVSIEGFFELVKATIKFVIVGALTHMLLMKWVKGTGGLWEVDPQQAGVFIGTKIIVVMLTVGTAMFLMSMVDYGFKKFRYEQKIKMTKQEAKEERKRTEGSPQIRARIRAMQAQVSQRRMMDAVKKADVVVTNPTHIAVALVYDRENMMAPKVVAKGADYMAEQIKKIARENGIPCVENVPLARAMYKALKIGQFISRDLYNAVAEVLAYVYRLKGRNI